MRNITLLPWFAFLRSLVFWQATWFLYFQSELSAAEAILLYVVYDVTTTALEVPSGYMSDRLGRRPTLIASAVAGLLGLSLLAFGQANFTLFALAQALLGAHAAFVSGTDSAMLYESLDADGREDEIEALELRVWRFSFVGFALSAATGGAMALSGMQLPFAASAAAFLVLVGLSLALREPPHGTSQSRITPGQIRACFAHRVLLWLLVISVLMYGYSHIPFVFGQPFIQEALTTAGYDSEAPLVSGIVTTIMMCLGVATSLIAPALRKRLGLGGIVCLAFGIQIALTGILGLTNAPWAIALLFLRMVPDSLSRPFVVARIQPLLADNMRATFLSLKSFFGRLLFALSLMIAAGSTAAVGEMSFAQMQPILLTYAALGLICLAILALCAKRVGPALEGARKDAPR